MLDIGTVYVDTSVLIKWFIEEKNSNQVDVFFEKKLNYVLSDLVVLEFDCTLRRIRRSGKITEDYRLKATQALAEQIQDQWFEKVAFSNHVFKEAKRLIEHVAPLPLRSLDAVHLTIAQAHHIPQLATADAEMFEAAKILGFTVHHFK
ncbi:MAG: type II toxin-antitoxin system VapC family toxin [Methylotenera sp.]|nr:type II toxin-antitoxin system VapC family toxin [Methylotenera sp.]